MPPPWGVGRAQPCGGELGSIPPCELSKALNQNGGPSAIGFFGPGRPSASVPDLSSQSPLALAQLDHQPKGFLTIGVGHRFECRIAAENRVAIAVDLGE